MELITLLKEQQAFSLEAFGPNPRLEGVCAHLRKEIEEVKAAPDDLTEWADCLLLCLDGTMRTGMTPDEVVTFTELDKPGIWREMDLIYDGEMSRLRGDAFILSRMVDHGQTWATMAWKVAASAYHHGISVEALLKATADKLEVNKQRSWPDWRTLPENQAIEHIKQ